MIPVLSRPADQIGASDLQALIDSAVPEGEQIEFKEALSTRDGSPDSWVTGGDLGNRARNELLKEAVAFANAYGGALLLGIAESAGKPPIATRISPVPRCTDLAERLKLVFRDCVEPEIPRVEIVAVPTEEDGDGGVIAIRTGRSRMAPHRVKPTRKCPIRRSDRCEEMTMREIQDLTLNLSRGLERVERRLAERSERFVVEFNCLESPDQAFGIRATAVPVGEDIQFDRVYGEDRLYEPWHSVSLVDRDKRSKLVDFLWGDSWRPMLRAARCEYSGLPSGTNLEIYREIHCDGLVEVGIVSCLVGDLGLPDRVVLRCGWLMTVFANLLVWADRVRNAASAPTAEYAVDVELSILGESVPVRGCDQDGFSVPFGLGILKRGSVRYPGGLPSQPRYSLGEREDIPELTSLFERDFWNSVGKDVPQGQHSFAINNWG